MAAIIAQTIAIGSIAEHKWSSILVHLLKADPATGMAMYGKLASAEARRAALLGAAQVRLSKEDFLLFQAVGIATRHARQLRNDFAHNLWGDSPEIPDALLLIEPECIAESDVSWVLFMAKEGGPLPQKADMSRIKVWRAETLREAKAVVHDGLLTIIQLLGCLIGQAGSDPAGRELHDQVRPLLLSRPLVAQALEKLSRQNGQ